jgi:8-oxo-dGTP pyrophosphatase MutT (NUDIX family)
MKIASGIGIIYKDLILLARRVELWEGKPIPLGGYWSIFAGSIDEGESLQECAIRELYEESEIKVSYNQLIDGGMISNSKLRFKIFFVELDHQPSPVLNEEHTEYGWFDMNKLDQFPYDIQKDLINCVKNYINSVI